MSAATTIIVGVLGLTTLALAAVDIHARLVTRKADPEKARHVEFWTGVLLVANQAALTVVYLATDRSGMAAYHAGIAAFLATARGVLALGRRRRYRTHGRARSHQWRRTVVPVAAGGAA